MAENETQQETQQELVPQLKHLVYISKLINYDTFKPSYVLYVTEDITRFLGLSKGMRVAVFKNMLFKITKNYNLGVDHFDHCQKSGRVIDVVKINDVDFDVSNEKVVVISYCRNHEKAQLVVSREIDDILSYMFTGKERLMIYDIIWNYVM